MKRLFGMIVLLAFSAHAESQLHTFTAQDGRTLEARIIAYDAITGKLQIERADRKKLTVPETTFSEKDQAYIKKWYVASIFSSGTKFILNLDQEEVSSTKKEHEVDVGEESGGGRRGGGDSGVMIVAVDKITQYRYKLLIDNKSDATLNNVMLEYRIYYEQQKAVLDEKANKGRPEDDPRPERYMAVDQTKVKEGSSRLKPIEPRSNKTLATSAVSLTKRSANRPWGEMVDLKSDMEGIWIKLTMKGPDGEEIVREISSSPGIPKKYSWETPAEQLSEEEPAPAEKPD